MTLLLDAPDGQVVGRQEPRVCSYPDTAVSSSGPDAVDFAALAGLVMDPWQEITLDVILKERADGRWAAREVGYLVGRQNGKGGILSALCLAAMFLFDDVREILFSAHEFKTAKKAYRDVKGLIEGTPSLLALVERRGNRVVGFRQSNEDTSITLTDGTVLRFMARSNNTGRGFSPQLVIADEAQECSQETRSALFYTIRAQPNPLVVWCGTVPGPKNQGAVFRALRNVGRKGGSRAVSWVEFSPDPDADPMDDQTLIDATPALGYRVALETVQDERQSAIDAGDDEAWQGFLREALSFWPDDSDEDDGWELWPEQAWAAIGDDHDGPGWLTGEVTLAVEVPVNRAQASIMVAGDRPDDRVGFDIVSSAPGTSWVVDHLIKLTSDPKKPVRRVVIDPRSPAGVFIDDLTRAGVEVTTVDMPTFARATGDFYDAVLCGGVEHRNREPLTEAVRRARWRSYGDSRIIDRRGEADTSPITGAILARHGHLMGPVETAAAPFAFYS